MPVAARLAPAPAVARSNTATESPRNASRQAIDKPMTPAPTTATSTAAGIVPGDVWDAAQCGCGVLAAGGLPIDPAGGHAACIKKTSTRFGWRFWPLVVGDLQSLRRCEPGQVQRISALPVGQRFLSPLSGISLERAAFNAAPRPG